MATMDSPINPAGAHYRAGGGARAPHRSWPESVQDGGRPIAIAGDVLLDMEERALEMVANRAGPAQVLEVLCDGIDSIDPSAIATALLAGPDGSRWHLAAGRRVPGGWSGAIALLASGLCTREAADGVLRRDPIFIADIAADPQGENTPFVQYREIAVACGLRSACAQPIVSLDGKVLGALLVFSSESRSRSSAELRLMKAAMHMSLIALEAARSQIANGAPAELRSQDGAAGEMTRKEEHELRRVIDAVPQHIIIFEPDGTPVYANRSMLDYTGLTLVEMKTTKYRSRIFHPEDLERLLEIRGESFFCGLPFEDEQRILGKDGQYRWFLIRYNPLPGDNGHAQRWYATGTDIDNRRQAEESTRNENTALREEIDRCSMFEEIVGSSAALRRVLAHVEKVARTDSTVLISGETGTGKELIARAIHRQSTRSAKPFIRVNCAAIPPSLIASELFGHEKGAFTGAVQRRLGRFESAHGGTILLDEVGELPGEAQIALLRVLQEREIERVGSNHPVSVDVRVVAATNRDLDDAVEQGSFRRDLYYRLNVFPIRVPSLRERVDDIPLLVEYLVDRYARKTGKKIRIIAKSTLSLLQAYHWPGNIRELQNVVERAVVLCEGENFLVDEAWLKASAGPTATGGQTLADSEREMARREREMIETALAECRGQIAGPAGAAARLGIPRQTLDGKIRSLRIDKYRFRTASTRD